MTAVRNVVAVWRWDRGEPVPDARLVVCAPGLRESPRASDGAARREVWALPSQWFIVPGDWERSDCPPRWIIPALHIRTQADLARLPDLLAVQAERRALVLSPKEEIGLSLVLRREVRKHVECSHDDQCPMCTGEICALDGAGGCGWGPHREGYPCEHSVDERHLEVRSGSAIDLVIIIGFDEPLHPEHVRSAVEQCRAAGVPVVFAGWGEWVPTEVVDPTTTDDVMERLIGEVGWMVPVRYVGDRWHARVGAARSGALLDGEPVADLLEWVSA